MSRGDALRELAAALRNEGSVRRALATWTERFNRLPAAAKTRRKLALGCDIGDAVRGLAPILGRDALSLGALLLVAERTGCPAVPAIETLAGVVDLRARERAAGQAAATAARNSVRAMALMPMLAAPLLLLAGVPLVDTTGLGFAAIAGALMYAGWRWIDHLVPDPPGDDEDVQFCELLAAALAGGLVPSVACMDIAPLFPRLTSRPARLVRLGLTWPEALARNAPGLARRAGELLLRVERSGSPVASELATLARERRLARRRAFDVAVKAAPVRMIWPLVACTLPAFCALTLVPLVRGVASSL